MKRGPKEDATQPDKFTWDAFRHACNKVAEELLGFECFDANDSYDLEEVGKLAVVRGQPAQSFVEEQFEEDLANKAWDAHLRQIGEADEDYNCGEDPHDNL